MTVTAKPVEPALLDRRKGARHEQRRSIRLSFGRDYGTDYRFNLSRGLSANDQFLANWNSSRFYGLDIPQMYAEVGVNDTSLKVGHFYTIIGTKS